MKAREKFNYYKTLTQLKNQKELVYYARTQKISVCCLRSRIRYIQQLKARHGEDIFELLERIISNNE